jgi:hypothetical protein
MNLPLNPLTGKMLKLALNKVLGSTPDMLDEDYENAANLLSFWQNPDNYTYNLVIYEADNTARKPIHISDQDVLINRIKGMVAGRNGLIYILDATRDIVGTAFFTKNAEYDETLMHVDDESAAAIGFIAAMNTYHQIRDQHPSYAS